MPSSKPILGVNDLQSQFPEIATEAYGWDPTEVFLGAGRKVQWKCTNNHIWDASPNSRTNRRSGCPYCSGNQVLDGFNDLLTQFPDIAAEADGWDPRTVTAGSNKKKEWICILGHKWETSSNKRTKDKNGCPICSNYQLLKGFNDLKTKFPEIAVEADGWDPAIVNAGTKEKRNWRCKLGHTWDASIDNRTSKGSRCPFCTGQKLLVGFNDLKTRFPDIAVQADGWDPSDVNAGTREKRQWKCGLGHTWTAMVSNRTSNSQGCPVCAEYGFNPEKDAWFYLMQRPGEQQLGITNVLTDRLRTHERKGWTLLEHTTEPALGQKVLDTEKAFKKWLKKEIGLIKGTAENWSTTRMEVQSLAELKARSGIETDLF